MYVPNNMHTLNGMCPNKPVSNLVHNAGFKSKYQASKLVRNISVETTVAQGPAWRTFSMCKSKFPSVETGTQYQSAQCLNWRTMSKCRCRNQSTQCLNWRTNACLNAETGTVQDTSQKLVPSKIPKHHRTVYSA